MTRYVIDAPTLLHLVAEGVEVSPSISSSRRTSSVPRRSRCSSPASARGHDRGGRAAAPRAFHRVEDAAPRRSRVASHRVADRAGQRLGDDVRCGVPRRHQVAGRRARHHRCRSGDQGRRRRAAGARRGPQRGDRPCSRAEQTTALRGRSRRGRRDPSSARPTGSRCSAPGRSASSARHRRHRTV